MSGSFWDLLSVSLELPKSRLYGTMHPADHTGILGGFLANPATQYSAFRNVAFLHNYPYALPGFVSGAFCLSASILGFISTKEVSWFKHTLIACHLMSYQ
jgi:hypothetical protein